MDALRGIADRLDEAAATLAGARPDEVDPGPAAWGGDNPGALGELTGALGGQLTAALHARSREAAAAGARLGALAADLRVAADGYADVDDTARRRSERLEPQ